MNSCTNERFKIGSDCTRGIKRNLIINFPSNYFRIINIFGDPMSKKIIILAIMLFSIITSTYSYKPDQSYFEPSFLDNPFEIPKNKLSSVAFTDNNSFLPSTNLSVTHFNQNPEGIEKVSTHNLTVYSLNTTLISADCLYSDGNDFTTFINRTSDGIFYNAVDYVNWEGQNSNITDFWINPSNFYTGFKFKVESVEGMVNFTVETIELISMKGIENDFTAWRLRGDAKYGGFDVSYYSWYESESGLFLSMKIPILANVLWYNLTQAEIAKVPVDYVGPELSYASINNHSINPSSTPLTVEMISPYGIHELTYGWNDSSMLTINEEYFSIITPKNEGLYNLTIKTTDNLNISSSIVLVYTIDNSIPGILLHDLQNNSRIQSTQLIQLEISNGNGTIIYNWDGVNNQSVPEDQSISLPNPTEEEEYSLNVYIDGISGIWNSKSFLFTIDNTAPVLYIANPLNSSIIRETLFIKLNVSETSLLSVYLDNSTIFNDIWDSNEEFSMKINNLVVSDHHLNITAIDEAKNVDSVYMIFTMHVNSFNWNYELLTHTANKFTIINDEKETLFTLTIVSSVNQYFNLTLLDHNLISVNSPIIFAFEFNFEHPENIDLIKLSYLIPSEDLIIFSWMYYDYGDGWYVEAENIYNSVDHSWETTFQNYVNEVILTSSGITTTLKSVELGGGQISGFELPIILLTLVFYGNKCIKRKKI